MDRGVGRFKTPFHYRHHGDPPSPFAKLQEGIHPGWATMPLILLDVFVHANKIHVWGQDAQGENHFYTHSFQPIIFFHTFNEEYAREVLKECKVEKTIRKDFVKKSISVLKITFPSILHFTHTMKGIEEKLRNVGTFYHVDIPLPEMFLFEHQLMPFGQIDVHANEKKEIQSIRCTEDLNAIDYPLPNWKTLEVELEFNALDQISTWRANGHAFHTGNVNEFLSFFEALNPDILLLHHSTKHLIPFLELCRTAQPSFSFSRLGRDDFQVRENSYFSYGKMLYRHSPITLKGRHLLAEYPHEGEGDEFTLLSYLEGSRVCRRTLQALVSHSIGSASNNRLMYEAYTQGWLIPYKVGIYEQIKPFSQLVENDRGPFTYEPLIGFHSNVVELDFASMYPSIMEHYNLSPEKFHCKCCSALFSTEKSPGRTLNPFRDTGYWFCQKSGKGIVPQVCKDFIFRRQAYKKRTDSISKAKVAYMKWLLVVIFGYQACTHKKIGTIEVHETINAIARETMMETIHLAEEHGFQVLHAIVDSLYVKKPNATQHDIQTLIHAVNEKTHLKLEYKHSFSRMVFLPSIVDTKRPVPGRFYGIGTDGELKLRGIEARQKSQPWIIRHMQKDVLNQMKEMPHHTPIELFRECIPVLRTHLESLSHVLPEHLAFTVCLGKTEYTHNGPQKQILHQLKRQEKHLRPGQSIQYIIVDGRKGKYVEMGQFQGKYDEEKYEQLMLKAYLNLFLPLHVTIAEIEDLLEGMRQMRVTEYTFQRAVISSF